MVPVELDKGDLLKLVKSCSPSYTQSINPLICDLGSFSKSGWEWNLRVLTDLSEKKLLEAYQYLRKIV